MRHAGVPRRRLLDRRLRGWGVVAVLALSGCTGDPAAPPSAGPPPSTPQVALLETTAIEGGMTEVVADRAFLDALDRLGLVPRVTGQAGFAVATGTFSFPVSGGQLGVDAARGLRGEVRHEGSRLLLTSGTSTVALDDLVLDADAGVVTATVTGGGGSPAEDAPVLGVDATGLEVPPTGEPPGPVVLRGLRVTLTAQGAELLNAALAREGFTPDAPVGSVTLTLEPAG